MTKEEALQLVDGWDFNFQQMKELLKLIETQIHKTKNDGLKFLWLCYTEELERSHRLKSLGAKRGNAKRKSNGSNQGGRPKIEIDNLDELLQKALDGTLTTKEALTQSKLKRATFYNRLRDYKNNVSKNH